MRFGHSDAGRVLYLPRETARLSLFISSTGQPTTLMKTRWLAHTTIMRCVQQLVPEFERRWNRFARRCGRSWRANEIHVQTTGIWNYLYRAVDREGSTVDFRLSPYRDVKAAEALFRQALETQGRPPKSITLVGYAASHRAAHELPAENRRWQGTKLRSPEYLNNMIDQDHRGVKSRTGPVPGFRLFDSAAIRIAGIELLNRIRKGQFALGRLHVRGQSAPAIRDAVLNTEEI